MADLHAVARLGPRVFGHVMPRTAARWLEQRMTTPVRPFVLPEADPVFAAGQPFRVPHGGGWLQARRWGSGPTVLLLHGWSGYAGQLSDFIDPLLSAGFSVVAFDAPAHGDSDGASTDLVDYAAAILAVAGAAGPVHAVIAHSFGGPAAALAARTGLGLSRLVLIAAPRGVARYVRALRQGLGLPARVDGPIQARFERRLGMDWEELELDRMASRMDMPVLVIHDREDRTVPWQDGEAVAAAAPRGRLLTTEGLGHRRVVDDPGVNAAAVDFVAQT